MRGSERGSERCQSVSQPTRRGYFGRRRRDAQSRTLFQLPIPSHFTHRENTIAGPLLALHAQVVVAPALEPLYRPVRQHEPGEHRVEEEDDREPDTGAGGGIRCQCVSRQSDTHTHDQHKAHSRYRAVAVARLAQPGRRLAGAGSDETAEAGQPCPGEQAWDAPYEG